MVGWIRFFSTLLTFFSCYFCILLSSKNNLDFILPDSSWFACFFPDSERETVLTYIMQLFSYFLITFSDYRVDLSIINWLVHCLFQGTKFSRHLAILLSFQSYWIHVSVLLMRREIEGFLLTTLIIKSSAYELVHQLHHPRFRYLTTGVGIWQSISTQLWRNL